MIAAVCFWMGLALSAVNPPPKVGIPRGEVPGDVSKLPKPTKPPEIR